MRTKQKKNVSAEKREEKQRRTEEEKNLQTNYRSPPIKRRDKPMKKQNRENEEKDSDTHKSRLVKLVMNTRVLCVLHDF